MHRVSFGDGCSVATTSGCIISSGYPCDYSWSAPAFCNDFKDKEDMCCKESIVEERNFDVLVEGVNDAVRDRINTYSAEKENEAESNLMKVKEFGLLQELAVDYLTLSNEYDSLGSFSARRREQIKKEKREICLEAAVIGNNILQGLDKFPASLTRFETPNQIIDHLRYKIKDSIKWTKPTEVQVRARLLLTDWENQEFDQLVEDIVASYTN